MKNNLTIYKTDISNEDILLIFSDLFAIYCAVKTCFNIGLIIVISLISLKLLYNMLLYFKWMNSFAVKINVDKIILNHSLRYSKVEIPFSDIEKIDSEKRCIVLKNSSAKKYSKVYINNLTDNDYKEIFSLLINLI